MKRLLIVALSAVTLLMSTSANAHCDSKHGHQDTQAQHSDKK